MRINIKETDRSPRPPRFRISETGIGLEKDQLEPADVSGVTYDSDSHAYTL